MQRVMNPPADTLNVSTGGFLHLYSSQMLENEFQSGYIHLGELIGVLRLADRRAERQTQQIGHERRTKAN